MAAPPSAMNAALAADGGDGGGRPVKKEGNWVAIDRPHQIWFFRWADDMAVHSSGETMAADHENFPLLSACFVERGTTAFASHWTGATLSFCHSVHFPQLERFSPCRCWPARTQLVRCELAALSLRRTRPSATRPLGDMCRWRGRGSL